MIYVGTIEYARVSRDGVTEYAVVGPQGMVMSPCFAIGGAGTLKSYVSAPYAVGSDVLLCSARGGQPPFFIVGGVLDALDSRMINKADAQPQVGQEYVTANPSDYAVRNGNSLLLMNPSSRTSLTAPSISLQLRGGQLSISQQGVAENELLNAQATIEELVAYAAELNVKIAALEAAILALGSATAAGLTALGQTIQAEAITGAMPALSAVPQPRAAAIVEANLTAAVNAHIQVP